MNDEFRTRRFFGWERLRVVDSFGSQAATSTQKAELEKKNLMEAMRESYAREKASLESEKAAYAREKEEAAALVSIFLFPYRQCE